MTRTAVIWLLCALPAAVKGQTGGDKALRAQADALFAKGAYAQAFESYQTLVGNAIEDFDLNFRYGVCALHAGEDKEQAIMYLKRSTQGPGVSALSWYFLGRAYHLTYRFAEALKCYARFKGTADKRDLAEHPVDALELQCRNGANLLNNLKEIEVRNKVEVERSEFFRYYDLVSIGGRIVVTPEELLTAEDRRSGDRNLVYLPEKPGPIWFASRGRGGDTGKDIFRTELLPDGSFAEPRKLAGFINTPLDEDFPFLAPDGRTFYFCSKGHNSMGGYDVFRSTYDPGLDVFGPPANMDFAVNTPDDELLYLTDPEGKEACFASGRDSRQGSLHVYRVSTAQAPVNITVMKGTFASMFDEKDRKAHIRVQDALTQETVSDVRTDMNGDYVLVIPRSGRYRFLVEAGPSGLTHAGTVEVPRNDAPRAYRQEMSLVDQGGEKLVIKNYFEEPLQEDMVALALDEVRRRARLDVNQQGAQDSAAAEAPKAPVDILSRAGFTGDINRTRVLEMAAEDERDLRTAEGDLAAKERQAMTIALQNADLSERYAKEAADLIARAAAAPTESEETGRLMTQAAVARSSARAHLQRSAAAMQAGTAYGTERMAAAVKATQAAQLARELPVLLSSGDQDKALLKLVELRKRYDIKRSPDQDITPAERMRREASERERQAAAQLQRANSSRDDENELSNRITRKEREAADAGGGRRQTIERELTEMRAQMAALREESDQAFAKARVMEQEGSIARGQAVLAGNLEQFTDTALPAPDAGRVTALAGRLAAGRSRIADLALDERYDAAAAEQVREMEKRMFDWNTTRGAAPELAATPTRTATAAAAQGGDQGGQARTMARPAADNADTLRTVAQATGGGAAAPPAGRGVQAGAPTETPGRTAFDTASAGRLIAAAEPAVEGDGQAGRREEDGALDEPAAAGKPAVDAAAIAAAAEDRAFLLSNQLSELKQLRAAEKRRAVRDSLDLRIAETIAQLRNTEPATADRGDAGAAMPDSAATGGGTAQVGAEPARDGEGDQVADASAGATEEANDGDAGGDGGTAAGATAAEDRAARSFDTGIADAALVDLVDPEHATKRARIEQDITDTSDRAAALHGLELMLIDSIDAESERQRRLLGEPSVTKEEVLSRMDRLRILKEQHVAEAARILAGDDMRYEATGSRSIEDPLVAAAAAKAQAEGRVRTQTQIQTQGQGQAQAQARTTAQPQEQAQTQAQAQAQAQTQAQAQGQAQGQTQAQPQGQARTAAQLQAQAQDQDQQAQGQTQAQTTAQLQAQGQGQAQGQLQGQGQSQAPAQADAQAKAPTQASSARPADQSPTSATPRSDAYMRLQEDPDDVYASAIEQRSTNEQVIKAVEERDANLSRMDDMLDRIDSLEEVLEGMDRGSDFEKLRESTDRIIDDVLILRMEIGQSQGYVTGSEYRAAQDSLRKAERQPALQALPLNEPVMMLAKSLQEQAAARMSTAAGLRKKADRSEVIVAKDSMLRMAYREELLALRDMDRAMTVLDYAGGELHKPGEVLTYEQVEQRLMPPPPPGPMAPAPTAAAEGGVAAAAAPVGDGEGADARTLTDQARAAGNAALQAADSAMAMRDQAANAARPDRERLEREGLRQQAIADSLQAASIALEGQAEALAEERSAKAAKDAFRQRMVNYYYLSDEEMALVMNDEDMSRYFEARSKAVDQRAQAGALAEEAVAGRKLANGLLDQSKALLADSTGAGRSLSPAEQERASRMADQAVSMIRRADSLQQAADRMELAARANESQAAALLQSSTPERGTEIMALEQRARRAEPMLMAARGAERPVAKPAPAAAPAAVPVTPAAARPASQAQAPAVAGAAPVAAAPRTEAAAPTAPVAAVAPEPRPEAAATAPAAAPAAPALLAPLAADEFVLGAGAAAPARIPMNPPMPQGIVFKVQVGAFRQEVPAETFKDMSPLAGENVGNGLVRYTAGMFTTPQAAARAATQVRDKGYRDAFVVAYQDGRRVPLAQAIRAALPATAAAPAVQPAPVPVQVRPAQPMDTAAADAALLAKYPATADQLLAQFTPAADAVAYYNDPKAAPARQVETVKGLFYTVQVGVYSKPTPLDKLFNITPLNSERTETNKIRYTTGVFVDLERARKRKDGTVALGVKDAFITAYLNGKRIPMREARALVARFGPSIFAEPALLTR